MLRKIRGWFWRPDVRTMQYCAEIADRQAWMHGGVHFDGPELNSHKIKATILEKAEEVKAGVWKP